MEIYVIVIGFRTNKGRPRGNRIFEITQEPVSDILPKDLFPVLSFYIPNIMLWIGLKKEALNIKANSNLKNLHLKSFRGRRQFSKQTFSQDSICYWGRRNIGEFS